MTQDCTRPGTDRCAGRRKPVPWRIGRLVALACLACSQIVCAVTLQGDPPVHRFDIDLDVYPQNFDVTQTPDGLVHVANSEGLLTFDGRRWRHSTLPDMSMIRRLAHDGGDRLYVGGFNEFGYFTRAADGRLTYHDLAEKVRDRLDGRNFADIWEIRILPDGVLFQALQHMFLYRPGSETFDMWHHADRFGATAWYDGRLLVQFRGEGLKQLADGEFRMAPGGDALTTQVFRFLPLPDGALLGLSRDGRWLRYDQGKVGIQPMPPGFPDATRFDATLNLGNDRIVLGTDDGRLFVLHNGNDRWREFRISHGVIGGLARALDGGIIAQTDLATLHIAWPAAWSVITPDAGLSGDVFELVPWQSQMLALTSNGVQVSVTDDDSHITRFTENDWTAFEAWDFLALGPDEGLLADSYEVLQITPDGTAALPSSPIYPRVLARSVHEPRVVYAGTELGLAILHRDSRTWHRVLEPEGQLARVLTVEETGPGRVLLGTESQGVIRVELNRERDAIARWRPLGTDHGLQYGDQRIAVLSRPAPDLLIASTPAGLFRRTGEGRFEATSLGGLATLRRDEETLQFARGPDGTEWAWSYNRLYRRLPGGDWQDLDISHLRPGVISTVTFDDDGRALFGASGRIMIFDHGLYRPADYRPEVRLGAVTYRRGDAEPVHLDLAPSSVPQIDLQDFSLAFEYALPTLDGQDAVSYQSRLRGYENEFGEWGNVTRITFSDLKPGQYAFEIRARDGSGHISTIEPFRFHVLPRWYQTTWGQGLGIAFLAVLALVLSWLFTRWRLYRINVERQRLTGMVETRTAELAAANRRLEDMAHLDGLTGLANRRRLDKYLKTAWQECAANNLPLSVILMDVDRFKRYNDRHGHLAGDIILKRLAGLLQSVPWNGNDLVARYGGEEFMAILPGTDHDAAVRFAEDIRRRVADSDLGVTLSAGAGTSRPGRGDTAINDLVHLADEALYEAKTGGRNRVGRRLAGE